MCDSAIDLSDLEAAIVALNLAESQRSLYDANVIAAAAVVAIESANHGLPTEISERSAASLSSPAASFESPRSNHAADIESLSASSLIRGFVGVTPFVLKAAGEGGAGSLNSPRITPRGELSRSPAQIILRTKSYIGSFSRRRAEEGTPLSISPRDSSNLPRIMSPPLAGLSSRSVNANANSARVQPDPPPPIPSTSTTPRTPIPSPTYIPIPQSLDEEGGSLQSPPPHPLYEEESGSPLLVWGWDVFAEPLASDGARIFTLPWLAFASSLPASPTPTPPREVNFGLGVALLAHCQPTDPPHSHQLPRSIAWHCSGENISPPSPVPHHQSPLPAATGETRLANAAYKLLGAAAAGALGGSGAPLIVHPAALRGLVACMRGAYNNLPFHSFAHAVAVAQHAAMLGWSARTSLTAVEQFAVLVAALGHDTGHPGHSNSFEQELAWDRASVNVSGDGGHLSCRSGASSASSSHQNSLPRAVPLALLFGDDSVLERNSAAIVSTALAAPGSVLENLPRATARSLRAVIVNAILATDMTRHFEIVAEIEKGVGALTSHLVHTADLSGTASPLHIARQWAARILNEFTVQANAEVARGYPQTPHMICLQTLAGEGGEGSSALMAARMQVTFVRAIVLPLYIALSRVVPELDEPLANIRAAREHFDAVVTFLEKEETNQE